MNMVSFVDELIRVGVSKALAKHASFVGAEPHEGLVGSSAYAEDNVLVPSDVATRIPRTASLPSSIAVGRLGEISPANDPIDNRTEGGRRECLFCLPLAIS